MTKNENTLDRVLRIGAGLALIALAATHVIGAWGYLGIAAVLIGIVGVCPLYSVLGINHCPLDRR
ncbi:MAG: DUF2892 domain-containing protein [Burkholderiales bacterium]|nr:DUF2892 domain-containing protein [Burkholderiales bacterium]MDE2275266.1 DUF2892 domain-containing protein [Burkholderiales bacterium]